MMLKLKVKTFDHGDAGVVPQGVDVQEQIMVAPSPEDKIAVNGVELTALSTLVLLRQALMLSTSGGRAACFNKLINHQKKM